MKKQILFLSLLCTLLYAVDAYSVASFHKTLQLLKPKALCACSTTIQSFSCAQFAKHGIHLFSNQHKPYYNTTFIKQWLKGFGISAISSGAMAYYYTRHVLEQKPTINTALSNPAETPTQNQPTQSYSIKKTRSFFEALQHHKEEQRRKNAQKATLLDSTRSTSSSSCIRPYNPNRMYSK